MEITLQEFIEKYGDAKLFDYEVTDTEVRVIAKNEISGEVNGFSLPGFAEAKKLEALLENRTIVMIASHVKTGGVFVGVRIDRI